jgi:hypothetical protein
MWDLRNPQPVKLIIGILAANEAALATAVKVISKSFGLIDLTSDVWPFTQTDYYKDELGPNALRQFVSLEKLIDPGKLAKIKHTTNKLERKLAGSLKLPLPRPVNLDPGIIEPSKLILASTKNFSHRIYIGNKMFAEVTLMYEKGHWRNFDYTFPDYREPRYHGFLTKIRSRLLEQLKT